MFAVSIPTANKPATDETSIAVGNRASVSQRMNPPGYRALLTRTSTLFTHRLPVRYPGSPAAQTT